MSLTSMNVDTWMLTQFCVQLINGFTFHPKGMFAIGWLELGKADKALLLLEKCFNNIQGPFQVSGTPTDTWAHSAPLHRTPVVFMCDHLLSQVWSESSDGSGAVNFLTGMGGFLQTVLFGFTGFRSVMEHPVSHSEKINRRTTINLCSCQSSEGVPGLHPPPAQQHLRALHPRCELSGPSAGLAAQKGRGLRDPEGPAGKHHRCQIRWSTGCPEGIRKQDPTRAR